MRRFFGVYLIAVLSLPALGLLAVLIASSAVSPEAIERGDIQLTAPCPRKLAGQPCSTCGLTRSFASIGGGRPSDAWRYNRAGIPLYIGTWLSLFAVTGLVIRLVREVRSDSRPHRSSPMSSQPPEVG